MYNEESISTVFTEFHFSIKMPSYKCMNSYHKDDSLLARSHLYTASTIHTICFKQVSVSLSCIVKSRYDVVQVKNKKFNTYYLNVKVPIPVERSQPVWTLLVDSTVLVCQGRTVYPKKYAHGFVVLCFVVVMQSFIMNSHEVFIHIHQGCFAGTGAIVRLPQCQWSKPDGYGKISQCITTTKHSKAKTVCIFLGIYCMSTGVDKVI